MNKLERRIVITSMVYFVVYITYALFHIIIGYYYELEITFNYAYFAILPFHFLCMALNYITLFITIQDLYLRKFDHGNQKLTWLLLILCTGGIGLVIYIFKHALKPRQIVNPSQE